MLCHLSRAAGYAGVGAVCALGGGALRPGFAFGMLGQVAPRAQVNAFGGVLLRPARRLWLCGGMGALGGVCLRGVEIVSGGR